MSSRRRRRRLRQRKQQLSVERILLWSDYEFEQTGHWPRCNDGQVYYDRNERWGSINSALRSGLRGLPGGSSLAKLLAAERGVRNRRDLPPLLEEEIAQWARAHHARTG